MTEEELQKLVEKIRKNEATQEEIEMFLSEANGLAEDLESLQS
ncbi:MAG: hypothetical protein R3B64_02710 [Candidatus Paceibacterota bacterium]